ncbi:MAG: alpha-amylase family protein [Acidobacteriota bacterium]
MTVTNLTRRRFAAFLPAAALARQPEPRRLRRAECYFGLHFDLHPNEKDTVLGRDVTPEAAGRLLDRVRPDFVQYDSKGHPGWLGWPSEVGPSAPGIVRDSLAVWRAETARRGIALFIHFSGVWDSEAVRRHPEWARLTPDGKPDTRQTSTFGPYVDRLMIPQLREAATKYELDGAWVDGECWATHPDYSDAAVRAFGRPAPKKAGEPGWLEWLEFNREQFRRYVRHYVDELHRSHPHFQIASNWLYSTMVPEKPELPVDFLSGDYLGNASISTARLEARYLGQTGKPWDLMAWGFQQADSNRVGHIFKPAPQLMQEAGIVLAQSGGFQVYYHPARSGHFEDSHVEIMAELAAHCRRLQKWSQHTETVPQIAVVFSKESLYRTGNKLFGGWGRLSDAARGWIDLLLACQWSVDVLPDWKLRQPAPQYPVIVLPDWEQPGEECLDALLDYARSGGILLLCGAHNAQKLSPRLGYKASGEPARAQAWLRHGAVGNAAGLWLDVEPGTTRVLDERYPELNTTREGKPAALGMELGKGQLIVVPGPIGEVYAATHAAAVRDFGRALLQPRFRPLVRVSAPPTVEVVLRRKNAELLVHLINTTAMQVAGDYATVDFIPPVGPIRLTVQGFKPKAAHLEPGGTPLTWRAAGGGWQAEIPRLDLHSVAVMVR